MPVVLIAVAVGLLLMLAVAWWVDRRDRREGRRRKNARQLGEDIHAARRAQRASLVGRAWLPRVRPDRSQPVTGYRDPDGSRRPVKRGQ